MDELITQLKKQFDDAIEYFEKDIAQIRTSRASASLVEDIKVSAYDSTMTVKELATITTPEPRMLYVQPWDKTVLKNLESALRSSDAGLNPVMEDDKLRIVIPPLTEERRKEFVKLLNQKMETIRIRIRQERETVWKKAQAMEKEKTIREDEKFKLKDRLQEIVDEYNKLIEEVGRKKEEELMS